MKIMYIGDTSKSHTNVITIATELEYYPDSGHCVRFGFAFSNKNDKFSKQLGRKIAIGRYEGELSNFCISVNDCLENDKPSFSLVKNKILQDIVRETEAPFWTLKYAK